MNENSFGILLGEFLDKAVMALDDVATAAEDFINKMEAKDKQFQHPADLKRLEILESRLNMPISKSSPPVSPSKRQKKLTSPKVQKAKEKTIKKTSNMLKDEIKDENHGIFSSSDAISDDGSLEIMATQTTGKAAGFSSRHYKITEASDGAEEEELEEEEEEESKMETSDYSDI
ncbi:hypothetical protein M9Y10_027867 [Tritrichomonas musculus]|uniref:Uncharacterized protein n=1 Tax=Tritrichomonas musculus TaxID=1915356 RepID=A0ABR2H492_9EUKA